MAEYIRTPLDYWSDPRTLRLKRLLGPLGAEYFQRLQAFAFRMAPSNGDLSAFEPAEIAKAVGYPDKHPPEKLLRAFVDATWCEWSGTGEATRRVRIRSWEVLQPFAVGSEERTQIARKAANAMHLKRAALLGADEQASHLGSSSSEGSPKSPKNGRASPSAEWPDEVKA